MFDDLDVTLLEYRDEIFPIIVEMFRTENYKKLIESDADIDISVEGLSENIDPVLLHPCDKDSNFFDYDARLRESIGDREYQLIIDHLQLSLNLKRCFFQFLHHLQKNLGCISYGHGIGVFFGNYSRTHLGVHDHVDTDRAASAFYFPLVGKKEMKIWDPSYTLKNPELENSTHYDDHLNASRTLSAHPGGMFYWPSSKWHIGSSSSDNISTVLEFSARFDIFMSFANYTYRILVKQPDELKIGKIRGFFIRKHIDIRFLLYNFRLNISKNFSEECFTNTTYCIRKSPGVCKSCPT